MQNKHTRNKHIQAIPFFQHWISNRRSMNSKEAVAWYGWVWFDAQHCKLHIWPCCQASLCLKEGKLLPQHKGNGYLCNQTRWPRHTFWSTTWFARAAKTMVPHQFGARNHGWRIQLFCAWQNFWFFWRGWSNKDNDVGQHQLSFWSKCVRPTIFTWSLSHLLSPPPGIQVTLQLNGPSSNLVASFV